MSSNWRNSFSPSLEQSGCILFGMLECSWSPLGEGELHWISAQLENCPVSSSSAVKWTVCNWYSKLYEHRWADKTNRRLKTQLINTKYLKNGDWKCFECKKTDRNLLKWSSKVLFHSYHVYLHSDQLVARVAVSYKLCVSTSAYHAALTLSWFWCKDGIMGQLLDGCERAVDSGGLLQCSVGGNTHQCPQQPRSSPTVLE